MSTHIETPVRTNTVRITRTFGAPVQAVWDAWTKAELFKKWWGPKNYTCPAATLDVRVGGSYLAAMRGQDGKTTWGTGTYREVVPRERLVYTDSFADNEGHVITAREAGMDFDLPRQLLVKVTFKEKDGKTTMELEHKEFPPELIADCAQGWNESFDKLERNLVSA
jgi:uncharacterized protein YndB with AHSA1/START domain